MIRKLIQSNSFAKQVSLLAGGTSAAQFINIAILPILTRLYKPDDFGAFAVMIAAAAILAVLISMRYENSIIAVDSDSEARVGVYSVLYLSILNSVFLSLLWLVGSYLLEVSFKYTLIGYMSIMLGLISSCTQAFYCMCNRLSLYRIMTKGRVYASLWLAIISITWGAYFESFWGLLLGSLFSAFVNLLYLWVMSSDKMILDGNISSKSIKDFLKKNIRFPKYLIASSALDRASSQGYLIVFKEVYGESVTGALSLYNKVAGLPSVLIGAAIGDVFKRKASEQLRKNGECVRLLLFTAATLFFIAIFPFFILLMFAPYLFVLVFGQEWQLAGSYAQLLAPVFLVGFVVSPISSLIYLEDNQKYDLYLQLILLIFLISGIGFAYIYGDAFWAVVAYALAYGLKYIIEFGICWKIAGGEKFK